jgi:sterol desaturase/sphingolipid hydroxylase (fatty acid hydroxylase superfamily)
MSILAALAAVMHQFGDALLGSMPYTLATAAVFTVIGLVATACNETGPWWRKRGLATDLAYMAVLPGLGSYARIIMLAFGLVVFYGIKDGDGIAAFLAGGRGPLSGLPFAAQVVLYLLISDLIMYGTHRLFHGRRLWAFHAVHHSSEDVEWISGSRFHPVDLVFHSVIADVVPLLLGIPMDVLVWLVPFIVGTSALVHANLNWTFGPFRYLLASPVFHRWHHTSPKQGGNRNFAGTFPFIDLLFGTFYMPKGKLPERYGVPGVPGDFGGQMLHPFRHPPTPAPARQGAVEQAKA